MNWKNFRPNIAISDFASVLFSVFIATWPPILTNWVSDVLGNYLHINTPTGAWYVIAAAIASVTMAIIFPSKRTSIESSNPIQQNNGDARYYLMQGGLLSLALVLTQVCQRVYAGPPTGDKLFLAILALIPALEGAFGSQFIHIANNQAVYYVDTAIRELVASNSHVSERMIIEHAKNLGKINPKSPFSSISEEDRKLLVRSRMVFLVSSDDLNQYLYPSQKIEMNLSNPKSWRFEKKLDQPVKTFPAASIEKIESQQRDAWVRLKANIHDNDAYMALCRYTYHTDQGLSADIKFEISEQINSILNAAIDEQRDLNRQEREQITILRNTLGETKHDKDQDHN